jgi:hypothetical protein
LAQLRNTSGVLRGQIDFTHHLEGFGPTMSFTADRPINCNLGCFATARGSLLFGDGESLLQAGEDLDLTTPFNTIATHGRDDLLPIGELRLGFHWQRPKQRPAGWQLFLTSALEGQIWGSAGSATSEDGSLGLFGFHAGIGMLR